VKIGQRAAGKGLARWLPVVGALGVGAYAYYDTGQVAATAIELFSGEVVDEADTPPAAPAKNPVRAARKAAGAAIDKAVAKTVRGVAKAADAASERKATRKRKTPPSPD
jgi:hypothetical protein